MKQLFRLTPLLLFTSPVFLAAQAVIVINEIRPSDDHVEIKNIGDATANISGWWLCEFPTYNQLSSLTVACGSLTSLAPGALVQVDLTINLTGTEGELALYVNSDFGDPADIRDYVEWGFHGHTRSTVAESAGIWADGDFVPNWSSAQSLEYDGSGNEPCNWETETSPSMPCVQNTTSDCLVMAMSILSLQAEQFERGAMISWTGMHDNTTDRIFLDRSSDLKEWISISNWLPEGPELVGGQHYDRYLQSGMHYYRLRIEYLDGSVDLSDITNVRICHEKDDMSIWPNPTFGIVEVFVATEVAVDKLEYVVIDPQGRKWYSGKGGVFAQLDLTAIPAGVYFLYVPALGLVRRITRT